MSDKSVGPILAVEDNPDDLFLLERAFEKAALKGQIQIARDGVEATDYLDGQGRYADRERFPLPGILILDLKLPRRSGLEVLAWMRERPGLARIPVVVLTSSSAETDIGRAYELGAFSYHVKPGSFRDLLALVQDVERCRVLLGRGRAGVLVPLPGARLRPKHPV